MTLTTGVRYDRYELHDTHHNKNSGSRISPSIGAIWDVNDDLALRASYNTASRSPRLYETMLADTDLRFGKRVKAEQTAPPKWAAPGALAALKSTAATTSKPSKTCKTTAARTAVAANANTASWSAKAN